MKRAEAVKKLAELGESQGYIFQRDLLALRGGNGSAAWAEGVRKDLEAQGYQVVEDKGRGDGNGSSRSRRFDSFTLYMEEAGKVPLLTKEQEVELSKRIEQGRQAREKLAADRIPDAEAERRIRQGEAARRHMIAANLRLVISTAKRYTRHGLPMADLVQEGNLGLIRAIKKFDYKRGYKFSTYATWWIRQAISRGVNNNSRTIRVPVHMINRISRMRRERRRLLQRFGREPTSKELAEELNMEPQQVEDLIEYARRPLSLDAPFEGEGDGSLEDLIPEENPLPLLQNYEEMRMQQKVAEVLEKVPPREAMIIQLRFGLRDGKPQSLAAIGRKLGITRERVRQIETDYLARLQDEDVRQIMKEMMAG